MKLVVATRNPGKLVEYRRMLGRLGFDVQDLDEAGVPATVSLPEEADNFADNARSKAVALQAHTEGWALGDDSGLEVDALGGAPGVYSARYAGVAERGVARDRANLDKLLDALEATGDDRRTARFVCAIVLAGPGGRTVAARGTCEGRIIRAPRGHNGFGYDPVFVPAGYRRTLAELGMDEKNAISHRGRALVALVAELERCGADAGFTG